MLNTMFKCLIICQFTLLLKLMIISFYIGCLDLETKMFEKCKSFTTIINIISLYRYGTIYHQELWHERITEIY
jgi:hypothetical protein